LLEVVFVWFSLKTHSIKTSFPLRFCDSFRVSGRIANDLRHIHSIKIC